MFITANYYKAPPAKSPLISVQQHNLECDTASIVHISIFQETHKMIMTSGQEHTVEYKCKLLFRPVKQLMPIKGDYVVLLERTQ